MNVVSINNFSAEPGDGVIQWTRFMSRDSTTCTTHAMTLDQLANHLVEAGPFREKLACPWIKLARFGDKRTSKGALRNNDNVLAITGVEGDYDGGTVTPEQAIEMLERANIRAIVYTSPSHRPHAPRWRVLAPLSKECPPAERSLYLARVNGALGGVLASESFTLSQSYFYGEVIGAEYKVYVTFNDTEEATCVDELHELDDIAIAHKSADTTAAAPSRVSINLFADAVEERGRKLKTGDGRRELLKTYIASRSAKGLTPGEIRAMVVNVIDEYFDPMDLPDAPDINDIINHFTTRDVKSQPADISAFTGKLGQTEKVDPDTGEIIQERPLFTRVSDLLGDIKPIQWLIDSYLEQDALSMLFGPSGGGKSFVVVDMACCIATGTPWHGMETAQGPVFYIAGEGHNGLTRRFAAWQKAHGVKLDESVPLYKSNRAVMMLDPQAALDMSNEVEALARATGKPPALVVIDTLARNFGDGDENTQKDAGRFIEHLDEYIRRRWNCNVMVVHHSGHDMDRARGSSAFKGAVDQELWVKGAMGKIEFKVTKMKDADVPAEKTFAITQIGLGVFDQCGIEIQGAYIKIDGDPLLFKVGSRTNGADITAKEVIKAMKEGWPGVPAMVTELTCSERSLSRIMTTMKDSGLAEAAGTSNRSGWKLTDRALDEFSKSGGLILN